MTNEQLRRLLLALNALRLAIIATIPSEEWEVSEDEIEASHDQAAAAVSGMEATELRA